MKQPIKPGNRILLLYRFYSTIHYSCWAKSLSNYVIMGFFIHCFFNLIYLFVFSAAIDPCAIIWRWPTEQKLLDTCCRRAILYLSSEHRKLYQWCNRLDRLKWTFFIYQHSLMAVLPLFSFVSCTMTIVILGLSKLYCIPFSI